MIDLLPHACIWFFLILPLICIGCGRSGGPAYDEFGGYNSAGGAHRGNDYSDIGAPPVDGLTLVVYKGIEGGFLAQPLEIPGGRLALIARNDTSARLVVVFRDSIFWSHRFPRDQHPMPGIAADSAGRIYVASTRGTLEAFSPEGKSLWQREIPRDTGRFVIPSPLLATAGGVIVGNSAGRLIRYDAAGKELWSIRRGASLADLFAADPERGLAIAATHNSYELSDTLLLLDHVTGAERWARPIQGARIVEGPAIVGGLIVAGVVSVRADERREPSLVAFTHDGKLAWRTPLPLMPRGIAGDNNGNLYISCSGVGAETMGGAVISFSPAGAKRWEVTLESGVPAPPAVSTDWVYFVARQNGKTGIFTYSRDGVFRNFLSIHLYPDVLAAITISSFGEILLSGMDVAAVLRAG